MTGDDVPPLTTREAEKLNWRQDAAIVCDFPSHEVRDGRLVHWTRDPQTQRQLCILADRVAFPHRYYNEPGGTACLACGGPFDDQRHVRDREGGVIYGAWEEAVAYAERSLGRVKPVLVPEQSSPRREYPNFLGAITRLFARHGLVVEHILFEPKTDGRLANRVDGVLHGYRWVVEAREVIDASERACGRCGEHPATRPCPHICIAPEPKRLWLPWRRRDRAA